MRTQAVVYARVTTGIWKYSWVKLWAIPAAAAAAPASLSAMIYSLSEQHSPRPLPPPDNRIHSSINTIHPNNSKPLAQYLRFEDQKCILKFLTQLLWVVMLLRFYLIFILLVKVYVNSYTNSCNINKRIMWDCYLNRKCDTNISLKTSTKHIFQFYN